MVIANCVVLMKDFISPMDLYAMLKTKLAYYMLVHVNGLQPSHTSMLAKVVY